MMLKAVLISQGLTLKRHIDATLGQGKVREAVRLPPGEDLNEWLAVNTVDFYNAISVLYSTLDECCTATTCPIMSAGPKVCLAVPAWSVRTQDMAASQHGAWNAQFDAECSTSTCGLMESR